MFNYCAGERDQKATALVLDMTKAFERVSLPVCGFGRRISIFPGRYCVFYVVTSNTTEGTVRKMCDDPLQTITPILPGSKWTCLLFRIVLQDALSEVTRINKFRKLRVLVDDITTFMKGTNKELVEMAEKVLKN